MEIVVTGAQGFLGKNLITVLREKEHEVLEVHRGTPENVLADYLGRAEFVFHLAGVNRPKKPSEFFEGNVEFTKTVTNTLLSCDSRAPIVLSSSTQAEKNNDYGERKTPIEPIETKGYKVDHNYKK